MKPPDDGVFSTGSSLLSIFIIFLFSCFVKIVSSFTDLFGPSILCRHRPALKAWVRDVAASLCATIPSPGAVCAQPACKCPRDQRATWVSDQQRVPFVCQMDRQKKGGGGSVLQRAIGQATESDKGLNTHFLTA